ncbi:MAG: L,D-transpeptidase family protein [Bacteriovoracaceae bacterium]|jgi:murein L,D-transpeptidase YafK|nr:L,D-transpeptidase family protein [Bacteriovoracaceae bacterium]
MQSIVLLLFSLSTLAAFLPSNLIKSSEKQSNYIIVVEKSTHTLHIYQAIEHGFEKIKSYKVATGKNTGNKLASGDKKTPEGIYFINNFRSGNDLKKSYGKLGNIYGAGAFTLNYPNVFDKIKAKTGHGIWLHSTDDDSRVSKGLDSKGCVVATDKDIRQIANYIELHKTPIIITQNLYYLENDSFNTNSLKINMFFDSWKSSWKNKDFKNYILHYSKKYFYDKKKGKYRQFKRYKKYLFSNKDKPEITFSNIQILAFNNTAIIKATQNYQSKKIRDIGTKTLYLMKDHKYNWKIVAEHWSKNVANDNNFNLSARAK